MGPIEKTNSEIEGKSGSPEDPIKSLAHELAGSVREGEAPDDPARLFIAFELPGEIVAQVTSLGEDLKKGFGFTSCRPAWLDPETLHLTLRFLGSTERKDIVRIRADLAKIARSNERPNLRVMGLDVFPDWRRPRVLWVGVKDKTDALTRLQVDIEGRCRGWGFGPEEKPYRPHLTLARFKSQKGVGAAKDIVSGHKGFRSDRFAPTEIILFESHLSPDGAKHTALDRYPLG